MIVRHPTEPLRSYAIAGGSLAGLLLLLSAGLTFRQYQGISINPLSSLLLAVCGGLCLAAAALLMGQKSVLSRPVNANHLSCLIVVIGVALLFIDAEISARLLHVSVLEHLSMPLQGLMFWAGVALLAWGLAGNDLFRWLRRCLHIVFTTNEGHILVGIVIAAWALRLWRLDSALTIGIDDGLNLFPLVGVRHFDSWPAVLLPFEHQNSLVFAQLQTIALNVFGYDLFGVRFVSTMFGALNVLALYLLARTLFGSPMALVAAAILATYPPHLHFSRLTMLHIADAAMGTFALAFLARAIRHNRRTDWVLSGVCLGLTQYFFQSGQLFFPPLVLIWLAVWAIFGFRRLVALRRQLVLCALAALLAGFAAYYVRINSQFPFANRMGDSGISLNYWSNLLSRDLDAFGKDLITTQILTPFRVYLFLPEKQYYYAGDQPLVLNVLAPLFLIGLASLVIRLRSPWILIPLWLLAISCANILLVDGSQYPRYIVAFPAIALTMAAGIRYTLLRDRNHRILRLAGIGLTGLVCLIQVVYYFWFHLPTLKSQIVNFVQSPDSTDAILRTARLPADTRVYLISRLRPDDNIATAFFRLYHYDPRLPLPNVNVLTVDEVTPEFIQSLEPDRNYAFFVEPLHPEVVQLLRSRFTLDPAQGSNQTDLLPDKQYILYFAPRRK